MFEAQVRRAPSATALIFGHEQLSYAELNRKANRFAHHLIALGVGPEVLVGLCVDPFAWRCSSRLLAILKAGGAYLPLDPDYPRERLAYMLEDAAVAVLLTQRNLDELLPQPVQPSASISTTGRTPQLIPRPIQHRASHPTVLPM